MVDATRLTGPTVVSQLQLSGTSTDVAYDATTGTVVVASNSGGLNLVDVSDPTAPRVTVNIPVSAGHVLAVNGVAYASVGTALQAFDDTTGEPLGTLDLNGAAITGIARGDGTVLFVMDGVGKLTAVDVTNISMSILSSVALPHGGGQLSVGSGVAYVSATNNFAGGFATVNVADPAHLMLIADTAATSTAGAPNPVVVANGSGTAVVAVSGFGTAPGVDVFDVTDPAKTGQFVTSYALPGGPAGLAIASGIGYVADGSGGLQVVNYTAFDNKGVAPTVTATVPTAALVPGAAASVYEGSIVPVTVSTHDDVQVRNVELLVNGTVVQNSVSFPWQLSFVAPAATAAAPTATVQVRVTDTGGNVALSTPTVLTLAHDARPPAVVYAAPAATARLQTVPAVTVTFNKPIDPAKPVGGRRDADVRRGRRPVRHGRRRGGGRERPGVAEPEPDVDRHAGRPARAGVVPAGPRPVGGGRLVGQPAGGGVLGHVHQAAGQPAGGVRHAGGRRGRGPGRGRDVHVHRRPGAEGVPRRLAGGGQLLRAWPA